MCNRLRSQWSWRPRDLAGWCLKYGLLIRDVCVQNNRLIVCVMGAYTSIRRYRSLYFLIRTCGECFFVKKNNLYFSRECSDFGARARSKENMRTYSSITATKKRVKWLWFAERERFFFFKLRLAGTDRNGSFHFQAPLPLGRHGSTWKLAEVKMREFWNRIPMLVPSRPEHSLAIWLSLFAGCSPHSSIIISRLKTDQAISVR